MIIVLDASAMIAFLRNESGADIVEGLLTSDVDGAFWQEVGRYEATNKVSLADCVAIALANRVGGDVATSDHHEFNAIATGRVCRVRFIR